MNTPTVTPRQVSWCSMGESEDQQLVQRVLKAVARKGLRDAEKALGRIVTYETVRRWRAGEIPPLKPRTREALENWLGEQPAQTSATYRDGALAVITEVEAMLSDLRHRLEEYEDAELGLRAAAQARLGTDKGPEGKEGTG